MGKWWGNHAVCVEEVWEESPWRDVISAVDFSKRLFAGSKGFARSLLDHNKLPLAHVERRMSKYSAFYRVSQTTTWRIINLLLYP